MTDKNTSQKRKGKPLVLSKDIKEETAKEPKPEKKVYLASPTNQPGLKLFQDLATVTGAKGYRTIMANKPIIEGTYYFEVKIEKPNMPYFFTGIEPQIRVGVATKKFDPEISLGSDDHSYAYKSIDGYAIHAGKRQIYSEKYGEGDIIGCLIHMKPPKPKVSIPNKLFGDILKPPEIEKNEGSKIIFFKNGNCLNPAYYDLNEGFYYASVSLYMNAKCKINFGPVWENEPKVNTLPSETRDFTSYSFIANEPKIYDDLDY